MTIESVGPTDLVSRINTAFFEGLSSAGVPEKTIARLQRVLSTNEKPSKRDLESALFVEDEAL